jgi:hypothetical protein
MSDNFKDLWNIRKPGAIDSARHKERVRKAIKERLHELIAEENIITSKDGKKIKIPMKYLDIWRFKFGKNNKDKGIGHGDGDPGDIIYKEAGKKEGRAGDEEGDEIYEEEIDVEEIIELMLEDLNLPWLEEKDNAVEIETEDIIFQDVADRGLPLNIDKRRTILENIKRNALKGKAKIGGFDIGDLKYRVWENIIEKHSNAAIFLVMDRSGSMTQEKKYIVKSFFWWMVRFIERKYKNVELIFIAHDTEASEVEEKGFFSISQSGGTKVSSGFILANKIIEQKFSPSVWNNYVFAFSDGDNFSSDNELCLNIIKELLPKCQSIGYGEVQYGNEFYSQTSWVTSYSTLLEIFNNDVDLSNNKKFLSTKITNREDVYNCLKTFLSGLDEKND